MASPAWFLRASLRALRAIHPALARPDDAFARARLPAAERPLYEALDPRDRDHAVRVTRRLLRRHPDAPPELVRAALLHDAGKAVRPFRLRERVLVRLLPPAPADVPPPGPPEPPDAPLRPGLAGARQVARRHEAWTALRVREAGAPGAARVAAILEALREPEPSDPDARRLKEADDAT